MIQSKTQLSTCFNREIAAAATVVLNVVALAYAIGSKPKLHDRIRRGGGGA
jgi:hypothetical protein